MIWKNYVFLIIMSIPIFLFSQENIDNNYTKITLGEERIEHWLLESPGIWKTSIKYKPLYVLSDKEYLYKHTPEEEEDDNILDKTWSWRNDTLYLKNTAGNPDSTNMIVNAIKDIGGWSVTSGDFNGDAIQDIVTMSGKSDSCCYIFYGNSNFSSFPGYTLKADERLSQVSSAGDINGDGYEDLMLATTWGISKVYIYFGSVNGINSSSKIELSNDDFDFGHLMSKHSGDINNDGFDDVLIGGIDPPCFCLYYGNSEGINSNPEHVIEFTISQVGYLPISFIGDINNDSFADIAVPIGLSSSNNMSQVRLFYGSPIGLDTTKNQLLEIDVGEESNVIRQLSV